MVKLKKGCIKCTIETTAADEKKKEMKEIIAKINTQPIKVGR